MRGETPIMERREIGMVTSKRAARIGVNRRGLRTLVGALSLWRNWIEWGQPVEAVRTGASQQPATERPPPITACVA
jgi:hypothetical protein